MSLRTRFSLGFRPAFAMIHDDDCHNGYDFKRIALSKSKR